jgi:hypothetical protein
MHDKYILLTIDTVTCYPGGRTLICSSDAFQRQTYIRSHVLQSHTTSVHSATLLTIAQGRHYFHRLLWAISPISTYIQTVWAQHCESIDIGLRHSQRNAAAVFKNSGHLSPRTAP